MRHRKDGRQFGRNTSHRRAMFRNLAANLVTHERIVTTDAKAKELRRVAERLITKAKRLGEIAFTPQDKLDAQGRAKRLHVSRQLASFLPRWGVDSEDNQHDLIEKVMIELSQRFADRPGGYTRIIKLGPRRGDNAPMSVIEFVDFVGVGQEEADETAEAEDEATDAAEPAAEKEEAKAEAASDEDEPEAEEEEVAEEEAASDEDEPEAEEEEVAEEEAETDEPADEEPADDEKK